jgi:DNA-nicking Smr family endonuclease
MEKLTSMPSMVPNRPASRISYTLDLHTFTVQQAYLRCQDFIYQHLQQHSHYVTVITGRGGQIADEFPAWVKNIPGVRKITPLDGDMESAGSWMLLLQRPKKTA